MSKLSKKQKYNQNMKNRILPVKNWESSDRGTKDNDELVSSLLLKCTGDEDSRSPADDRTKASDSSVSIRCRRHKKRFNVPVTWLDTCEWLCPRCYQKLTPDERARYAPRRSNCKDVKSADNKSRKASIGIHTPQTQPPLGLLSLLGERPKENGDRLHIKKISDDSLTSSALCSDYMQECLPRFRIHCLKCGHTVPCHKVWFENSAVLCPSCYSGMTHSQVQTFHASHPRSEAKLYEIELPPPPPKPKEVKVVKPITEIIPPIQVPELWSCIGRRCSEKFIAGATREELKNAVLSGRLSKARARIELLRRRNRQYFNSLPEVSLFVDVT